MLNQGEHINGGDSNTKQNVFDLVVIGGGLTGVAVLNEAAHRGLRCMLLERNGLAANRGSFEWSAADFSSLRVSPQRWSRGKSEAQKLAVLLGPLLEKHVLLQDFTNTNSSTFAKFAHKAGLSELLNFRQDLIEADELVNLQPGLGMTQAKRNQVSLFRPQRLIPLLARAAQDAGAEIHCGQNLVAINPSENRAFALQSQDLRSGQKNQWLTKRLVNASGDQLGQVAALAGQKLTIQSTRHLYLRFACPINVAIDLGQGCRLLPDGANSVLGPIALPPGISLDDVDNFNFFINRQKRQHRLLLPALQDAEVQDSFVRSLAYAPDQNQNPSRLIREARIFDHRQSGAPGFVSIVAGQDFEHQWLAQQLVDNLKLHAPVSQPAPSPLPGVGARCDVQRWTEQFVLPAKVVENLTRRHAGDAHKMLRLSEEKAGGARLIAPGPGLCAAELEYIGQEEFCQSPKDVLQRSDALASGSRLDQVIMQILWIWRWSQKSAASQMLRDLVETLQVHFETRRALLGRASCAELYTELMTTGLSANLQVPANQNQEPN